MTCRWCQRLTRLVVSRQKFSAMRALIEQLGLPIDKVGSSQDVEFLGKTEIASTFSGQVGSSLVDDLPGEIVVSSQVDENTATK